MKRIAATVVALVATVGIAACGSNTVTTKTVTQPTTTTKTVPAPVPPVPVPTPAPPKVSLPPALATAFLKGCNSAAGSTKAKCGCELAYLQANVSLNTILSYKQGTTPPWIIKAAEACIATV